MIIVKPGSRVVVIENKLEVTIDQVIICKEVVTYKCNWWDDNVQYEGFFFRSEFELTDKSECLVIST